MTAAVRGVSPQSTSVSLPCVHCGETTVVGLDHDAARVFCCRGCEGAHDLIHGLGLDDFYALRDQVAGTSTPNRSQQSRFDDFDSADFLGRSAPRANADGCLVSDLAVGGLHCAACAWLIENTCQRFPGWAGARVRMNDHTIRIAFDPTATSLSRIAAIVHRLGYTLSPLGEDKDAGFRHENRRLLIQIAMAGFFAANAMWIAVALYAGDATGLSAEYRFVFYWFGTALGVASVAIPGRVFFRGAIAALRSRTPHMDLPVALGLCVGTISGLATAVTGQGETYFDSIAVLVFLLLIGRWIQFRQQHRAAGAIDLLLRVTPRHANRIDDFGETEMVLVDRLSGGDMIRVGAGEGVPADGIIIDGDTMIDRALLTGESRPEVAMKGDEVAAGTVNLRSSIDVRVERVGRESRIGKVMSSVEEAMASRAPIALLADRIGGVFVAVVTLLSLGTLAYWWSSGVAAAASHATSLLIVACPCALALATPLAIAVALGRAAKRRILIRDGSAVQLLSRSATIWFDKTGTLTEGRVRIETMVGDDEDLRHAAAVEIDCIHPIADAITAEARRRGMDDSRAASEVHVGEGGVSGRHESLDICVGSRAFLRARGVTIGSQCDAAADECLADGVSPVFIAVDRCARAVLRVIDPLKPDSRETIDRIRRAGWRVGLLSGDHPRIVASVAKRLGIAPERALGGMSPEDKLRIVRDNRDGVVAMIGDGANDAAALAAADVGIAVRGGAEVSLQAASIFIASGGTTSIATLIHAARSTMRLIYVAMALSLAYNGVAVGLAMAGQITPLIAAVLMPISSISVLALVLSWPTFREVEPHRGKSP